MMLAMMAPVGKSVGAENRRDGKHNKLKKNNMEYKCLFVEGVLALLARVLISSRIKQRGNELCPQRQQIALMSVTRLSKVLYKLLSASTLLPTAGHKRQQVRG